MCVCIYVICNLGHLGTLVWTQLLWFKARGKVENFSLISVIFNQIWEGRNTK